MATPQWGWNTENMDPEREHPSLMGKKLRPSLRLGDLNIGFQERFGKYARPQWQLWYAMKQVWDNWKNKEK